jgi:hypothetical protein
MNPLFLQLIIKEKLKRMHENKKKGSMMNDSIETKSPLSILTVIRLTILSIILYLLDSVGWFIFE